MIIPQKLNSIGIVVRDLQHSLAWYKEKFGFERLFDVPNGVIIGANGVELWVAQAKDPVNARQTDHAQDICIRLIGFEVSEEDLSRVKAEFPEDTTFLRSTIPDIKVI
jgi:catechol 2,3-dioxygenase-like lactoylglutathione lyase family enzyme